MKNADPSAVDAPHLSRRDRAVDSVRRLLAIGFAFISLFLVVRTVALEPFGVPTGSMAVTLFGNHRECACPRCGYPVVIGSATRTKDGEEVPDPVPLALGACPNCGKQPIDFNAAHEIPGDRLLVDKNVFQLRSPRRWEVCVFRCPVDDSKPYVKRVIGMPGEAVQLQFGDAYANGELLRKTQKQYRECRVPVFDQAFAPPAGWGARWLVERLGSGKPAINAGADVLTGEGIALDGTREPLGLTYRNWNLDSEAEEHFTDWLAYNGTAWQRGGQDVHDFSVEYDLDVQSGSGTFALRLFDGLDSVSVEFPVGGMATLGADGGERFSTGLTLEAGKSYRVEFSFVDRRMSLSVNGKVIAPAVDLPADDLANRKGVTQPVQFGVSQASVLIRNFKIYRDVYLRSDAANGTIKPWQLGADEYFLCGDNSNNSKDSREWAIPGVPERDFLGKPFLIHQPLKLGTTTIGGPARHYHAIDWDRLRWVR